MKHSTKEYLHYLILSIVSTGASFGAFFLGNLFLPFMNWIQNSDSLILKIIGYSGLFIWFLVIDLIFFIPLDKILHSILDI